MSWKKELDSCQLQFLCERFLDIGIIDDEDIGDMDDEMWNVISKDLKLLEKKRLDNFRAKLCGYDTSVSAGALLGNIGISSHLLSADDQKLFDKWMSWFNQELNLGLTDAVSAEYATKLLSKGCGSVDRLKFKLESDPDYLCSFGVDDYSTMMIKNYFALLIENGSTTTPGLKVDDSDTVLCIPLVKDLPEDNVNDLVLKLYYQLRFLPDKEPLEKFIALAETNTLAKAFHALLLGRGSYNKYIVKKDKSLGSTKMEECLSWLKLNEDDGSG